MKRILIGLALLASGCGSEVTTAGDEAAAAEAGAQPGGGAGEVVVEMEGKVLIIPAVDWQVSTVEDIDGERRYLLTAQDMPLTLNLNVKLDAIPTSFPAAFTFPDVNNPNIKADLNFFNQDRDSKQMQKRIIFSKGTINIRAMSENALDISFDGSGHPLTRSDMFPIKGSAKVSN